MKRRWFTVGGVVEIAIAVGAAALLSPFLLDVPLLETPQLLVWVATFLVSGVLAVLGGEGEQIGGLEWRQLIGLSYVVFALGLVVWYGWQGVTHPGDRQILLVSVLSVGGALVVGFMGLDLLRGAKHFDISA